MAEITQNVDIQSAVRWESVKGMDMHSVSLVTQCLYVVSTWLQYPSQGEIYWRCFKNAPFNFFIGMFRV